MNKKNIFILFGVLIVLANIFILLKNEYNKNEFEKYKEKIDSCHTVSQEYFNVITDGVNAPFEVIFGNHASGKTNEEFAREFKNRKTLVIDTAWGTKEAIKTLHENGNEKVLMYINVGSLDTEFVQDDRFDSLKLANYEGWEKEYWVDVRDRKWKEFICEQAKEAVELGADGFFLDNYDVYSVFKELKVKSEEESLELYDSLYEIIDDLAEIEPCIMINGGDEFIKKAIAEKRLDKKVVSINQETVFTFYKNDKYGFRNNEKDKDFKYFKDYLKTCKDYGLDVYLLEYGKHSYEEVLQIKNYCIEQGITYVIAPGLDLYERWEVRND